jgi:hypothetical protein
VTAYCAHIIPFSISSKVTHNPLDDAILIVHVFLETQTHSAIEMFTGNALNADFVLKHMNHPSNALNLDPTTHDSRDKYLAWGIEARFSDNQASVSIQS